MIEVSTINVIGAGGTGSFLLSHLARIIKGHDLEIRVNVWDGDRIEHTRNLLRAPILSAADIGRMKSDVICTRLNLLYGLDSFRSYPYFLLNSDEEDLPECFWYSNNIDITCVDSMKLRQKIAKQFQDLYYDNEYDETESPIFWMDCGNDRNFGQVYLGWNDRTAPYTQWPNFSKQKEIRNGSCSIAAFQRQGALINDMAALAACDLIAPTLQGKMPEYVACYFGPYGMRKVLLKEYKPE